MPTQDIDPRVVLAALGDFSDADCTPLTGGIDARMWRVDTGGERYALRLLARDQVRQAEREIAVGRWVWAHDLPVPGIVVAAAWQDRPVCLMEWAEGETLAAAIFAGYASTDEAARLGREFGRTQARLHLLPAPIAPAIIERDWRDWAGPDGRLAAHLGAFVEQGRSLIHLDYHPLNVLAADGRITAVLDWANAHIGDPRVDLARTLSILELAPLPDADARQTVQRFIDGWRDGYAEVAGWFDIPPLLRWWAGAAMERDLAPKVGSRDAPWLNEAYLGRIRAWTDAARATVEEATGV